jgi:hypothetical protein
MWKDKNYEQTAYNLFCKNKNFSYDLVGGEIIKPDWIDMFLLELDQIYDDNYVITGSGALILYLNYFNNLTEGKFNEFITNVRIPNDVDFLYYCKGSNYESSRIIGQFSRLQDSPQRSVTYVFNSRDVLPNIIKSFDLTCLSSIPYVSLDKYKVLSLEKILSFYSGEVEDNEMMLRSNKEKILELEKSFEDSPKKRKLNWDFDLKSEYDDLEITVGKIENKLLALELKINIINILTKNIKIEPAINSIYQLKYIPEIKSATDFRSPRQKLFPPGTVRKLFDFLESPDEKKYDDTDDEKDAQDINPQVLFEEFAPGQKPMLPMLSSPNITRHSIPTTPDSTRRSIPTTPDSTRHMMATPVSTRHMMATPDSTHRVIPGIESGTQDITGPSTPVRTPVITGPNTPVRTPLSSENNQDSHIRQVVKIPYSIEINFKDSI